MATPAKSPLFGDVEYKAIRSLMHPDKVGGRFPDTSFSSWKALCEEFAKRAQYAEAIHTRIEKWNPCHTDTIRFKGCWNRVYQAFQDPSTDSLEAVARDLEILAVSIKEHNKAEGPNIPSIPEEEKS